ncbi:MAG TPA: DMT family transporter [Chloroflexi bacterium]|jgi:drug/metabolite transporter (DMT)-like permease|nr:DMT family transporter [Chloroflexota bacterium]
MSSTDLALLLLLSAIWGASFLFIKIGVSEIGPVTFSALRMLIGAVVLAIIVRARRQPERLARDVWRRMVVVGLLGTALPFSLIGWGTQFISSGLAAILNATTPLFAFILATALGSEELRPVRALGVLMGFGGILVLMWPELHSGRQGSFSGQLAVVSGALCYAISAVYMRRHLADQPALLTALGQVGLGCLILLPCALLEQPWRFRPSPAAVGALLALGSVGTGVAYILYVRLIQGVGATSTSLVTQIVPMFAVVWGWLVLAERPGWNALVALAMIMGGLFLVNGLPLRRRPSPVAMDASLDGAGSGRR